MQHHLDLSEQEWFRQRLFERCRELKRGARSWGWDHQLSNLQWEQSFVSESVLLRAPGVWFDFGTGWLEVTTETRWSWFLESHYSRLRVRQLASQIAAVVGADTVVYWPDAGIGESATPEMLNKGTGVRELLLWLEEKAGAPPSPTSLPLRDCAYVVDSFEAMPREGDAEMVLDAAELLFDGKLVAFPTETVYGLGADATNRAAVRKIFEIKGRPSTNPLICHVADVSVAKRYARDWPLAASRLAERFWPGPLTIVLPKTSNIPDEVTAGLESVGLRAPEHPLTLELLRTFDKPLAGPSANRSAHVSPTTAEHVREDLGERVDLILDGGACRVGIESTVLDLTTAVPLIRRVGAVSREEIETVIGSVEVSAGTIGLDVAAKSPGQHEKHYAPRTPAIRFEAGQRVPMQATADCMVSIGNSDRVEWQGKNVVMPNRAELYAMHLYAVLREVDRMGLTRIYIQMPPDEPQWAAVRDRLMRATRPLSG